MKFVGKLSIALESFYYEGETKSKDDIDAANRAMKLRVN